MKVFLQSLFILINLFSVAIAQDLVGDGMQAYRNKDFQVALKDFQTAAKAGKPGAQNDLGVFYARSLPHTEEKYNKAIYWFGKAIKNDVPQASYNLGNLYANGQGVKRNFGTAIKYYKSAAKGNYLSAQRKLGLIYFQGREVKRDLAQAYLFLSLASAHNDTSSINLLTIVSKQMNDKELAQANLLVKQYKFSKSTRQYL